MQLKCEYSYVVEQQPIGQRLFRLFCSRRNLSRYGDFLDAVEAYELMETEEARRGEAPEIARRFLTRPATSDSGVDTCEDNDDSACERFVESLTEGAVQAAVRGVDTGSKDLFAPVASEVRVHLAGHPFKEFLQSMYFHR